VNTKGPWYLASRLAPRMGRAGGGVVINVISVGGIKPPAYMGFYAATKAALNALTRVMAAEWAPLNIRVNSLAPGNYHSDLFDTAAAAAGPEWENAAKEATLQKRVAETDEIIGPVLYLASDMSKVHHRHHHRQRRRHAGALISDGAARAVRVAVGNLFLARGAHLQHLDIEAERAPGERMVGVHVGIELAHLHHRDLACAVLGLHRGHHPRTQAPPRAQVLQGHALDRVRVAQPVGLLRRQRDRERVPGRMPASCSSSAGRMLPCPCR